MTSDETQIQILANWPMSHAKRVPYPGNDMIFWIFPIVPCHAIEILSSLSNCLTDSEKFSQSENGIRDRTLVDLY